MSSNNVLPLLNFNIYTNLLYYYYIYKVFISLLSALIKRNLHYYLNYFFKCLRKKIT
jgi:hypothetical protein